MRDPELVARAQRTVMRLESAGQADRISAGRHRRIPEFGASGRASILRPRPPVTDQARDLAGWTSGELPDQVNEQLTSWPPSADQPPASA